MKLNAPCCRGNESNVFSRAISAALAFWCIFGTCVESSTLDADEWREPRHTPGKARLLSRQHDSTDIFVGARGFLRDAAG